MERYDYREHVKQDVLRYLRDEVEWDQNTESREDLEERLYDDLMLSDSVTGNASGSYTMSTWQAEEYLAHNWDLLVDAAEAFGSPAEISTGYDGGAEYWDVTIRCYVLGEAISEAVDEWIDEMQVENSLR